MSAVAAEGAVRRWLRRQDADQHRAARPAEIVTANATQSAFDGVFLHHVPDRPQIVGAVVTIAGEPATVRPWCRRFAFARLTSPVEQQGSLRFAKNAIGALDDLVLHVTGMAYLDGIDGAGLRSVLPPRRQASSPRRLWERFARMREIVDHAVSMWS